TNDIAGGQMRAVQSPGTVHTALFTARFEQWDSAIKLRGRRPRTFMSPAAAPTRTPPGNVSFGTLCRPAARICSQHSSQTKHTHTHRQRAVCALRVCVCV
ncbi:MAG TPA: hypothetical protein V6C97_06225, partial [Oculatellaceae cyanobacterium]